MTQLMEMTDSPVVVLNRAGGCDEGAWRGGVPGCIDTSCREQCPAEVSFAFATQGHVLAGLDGSMKPRAAFSAALECDCTLPEKRFLQRQLAMLSI